MFDFTKEIRLEGKWGKRYPYLRGAVFSLFTLIAIFIAYKILFPSASFTFSFHNPNSSKNTVIDPRLPEGNRFENGNIPEGKSLVFDTALIGDFSKVSVDFNLEGETSKMLEGKIWMRKSYRSFFYPVGKPLGFRDGSLLKNGSEYFMVSDGSVRRFASLETAETMGFKKTAFIETPSADLLLHTRGNEITSSSAYPTDSLFRILDEYYQLKKDGVLFRFVSEKAYLSRYSPDQAIEKNPSFLEEYVLSEDYVGFSDGTLLSADISVYIASSDGLHPVNNPITFESMGYLWSEIIPADSEEIGMYEEQDLFTMKSAHPDGTIFYAKDSGKYYYVQNGMKREITSPHVLSTYRKSGYVEIEEKGLETETTCLIEPSLKLFGLYKCDFLITPIKDFPGNDFQFSVEISHPMTIEILDIEFSQTLTWENMKKSLSVLKNKIMQNYGAR